MHKLKRIVFYIMLISFIIKANECYGMKTNENKGDGKTVMEKIKALPYPKIFIYGNKLFFSLAHSIINNFYELEKLEMNKVYSLKKYLCWGYRLQPTFLAPFSFLDFNVNILGVVLDTFIPFCLARSWQKLTTPIFYFITGLFNINLWVRISKDFYISINILGLMRAIFMPFLIKNNNKNENNNNLDINLSNNNNPGDNNENNIVNNNQDIKNNNKNENDNNLEDKLKNPKIANENDEENNEKANKMFDELDEEFVISNWIGKERFKQIIIENNFDRDKLIKIIEEKLRDI